MAPADAASATSCFPPPLATSCFLPGLPSDARTTPRASPTAPHSLPSSPPPLFLSPSRTRAEPPPPTSTTAATISPSTPRCACELRHNPLHLLVELRTSRTCCNAATIAVSIAGRRGSSSSIHHHRRVPEPANHPYGTAVSSHASPPSFPLRLRPVASIPPEPRARLRRRCRRRRCRSPNSRPSMTSSSWISQEPAQPLSSLAR